MMIVRTPMQLLALAAAMLAPVLVFADCQCGYSLNATSDTNHAVYTDLIESDFTLLTNITTDTDWVPQAWEVGREESKGPYGRRTELRNVVSNPAKRYNISAEGINGDLAGLELYVRKLESSDQECISVAEVDTRRTDMLYGSFRAGIRTSGVNGTCGAFFWYFNDTQEIDMEFLSSQIKVTSSPVNLVLHSSLSFDKGGDAQGTPTYKVVSLPFASNQDFHEYRFDWQPGKVSFYVDGDWLVDMTDPRYVPKTAGKIVLSHWSNGNPLWSGGPPEQDAKMTVSYVQAFFNSSLPARQKDYLDRCKNASVTNAVCRIPNLQGPPRVGKVRFFSQSVDTDRTPNQTVYGKEKSRSIATGVSARSNVGLLFSAILLGLFVPWIVNQ